MTASIFKTCKVVSATRIAVFTVAALALAGCETDGTGPLAAGAPKAELASAAPKVETPKAEAPKAEAPKPQVTKPAEPAADSEPMTHARAARECWMRTEKSSPGMDLDRRADIVNKCIDEKMKAAGAPAPKS